MNETAETKEMTIAQVAETLEIDKGKAQNLVKGLEAIGKVQAIGKAERPDGQRGRAAIVYAVPVEISLTF